jgi:hypothetical protein
MNNVLPWILIVGPLLGCGKQAAQAPSTPPKKQSALEKSAPPPRPRQEDVSEAEATEYAERAAEAIVSNDVAAINRLLDLDELIDRATQGGDATEKVRVAFQTGLRQGLKSTGNPMLQMAKMVAAGGQFRHTRLIDRGKSRAAQFRLIRADGGSDYFMISLRKGANGEIVGTDLYTLSSGENISNVLRRFYLMAVAEQDQGLIARLSGSEQKFAQNASKFGNMARALQSGNFQAVIQLYDSLPPELQAMKPTKLLRIAASVKTDDKLYAAALEDFREAYPGEPCADFMSIDHYFMRGEYEQAVDAIDRTSKFVGGDAYMEALKGQVLLLAGDRAAARAALANARADEPTLINAYWMAINVELAEKDYAAVASLLTQIDEKSPISAIDLRQAPLLAEFVETPEGKAWLDARPAAEAEETEPSTDAPQNEPTEAPEAAAPE